jgi:hypothetical protein
LCDCRGLDRLSRDQEDIAAIYKRLRHSDIRVLTFAEGEISELHVGLKGTMNALFLKDLALKIRRGLTTSANVSVMRLTARLSGTAVLAG